jgi:fibronectin-binding autotransporter adhesin
MDIGGGGVFSPSGDWSGFSGTLNFTTGNWLRELNTNVFGSAAAVWNFGVNGGLYNKFGGATIYLGALFGGASAELAGANTTPAFLTTYVIGGVNTNSVFAGTISDGSAAATTLTFAGPGSLSLSGSNTFSGGVIVNGGTLFINNTAGSGTGSGTVTVNSGATLGGTGTMAGITSVGVGGALAPGNNTTGLLTISNDLSLNNGCTLQFQLGATSDRVAVYGDLTLGGTLNISNAAGFGAGAYTLFTYTGALGVGNLSIGSTPAGYNYAVDTSVQGEVNLVVSLPRFGSIMTTSNGLVMSGSGGVANGSFYLLTTTNLATPLTNWTRVLTNQFDTNGNFNFTIPLNPILPRSFYLLEVP